MRISDWSSDVCSSDLRRAAGGGCQGRPRPCAGRGRQLRHHHPAEVTMAEAASPILFERRGAVGWLMFDRPARRNAIDAATHLALREALPAVEAARAIRALVITGPGGAFRPEERRVGTK